MHSRGEGRKEEERAAIVGHVANLATKPRIAGMVATRAHRLEKQKKEREKERTASKPWAKATARTQGVRQAVREVARKDGTQMGSVDNVIPAGNLDTVQDGVRRQVKEEEEEK